jgi:hypothetical protein
LQKHLDVFLITSVVAGIHDRELQNIGERGHAGTPSGRAVRTVHAEGGSSITVALHLSADLLHNGMLDIGRHDMPLPINSSIVFESGKVNGL